MPRIRAVVFDLDDTLYPEREYAFSGFAAVAAAFQDRLGDPEEAAADMRRLFDTAHRRRVFNAVLASRGLPEDDRLIHGMIEAYRAHPPAISLYSDAEAALSRLRGLCKLGLITDGPAVMQRAKVEALALADRLDAVILTDELGPEFGKPHPRAFELAAHQLPAAPAECVYVADNVAKDFVAPNQLGWTTIHIQRPGGVHGGLPPAPGGAPDHALDTLDHLDSFLL